MDFLYRLFGMAVAVPMACAIDLKNNHEDKKNQGTKDWYDSMEYGSRDWKFYIKSHGFHSVKSKEGATSKEMVQNYKNAINERCRTIPGYEQYVNLFLDDDNNTLEIENGNPSFNSWKRGHIR